MSKAFYSISTLSLLYRQDSCLNGKSSHSLCFSSSQSLLCVHKSTQVIPQFCNAELLFSACRVLNYIANLFLGNRLDNNIKICLWPKYFDVYHMLPKVIWNHWLHATNTQIQLSEKGAPATKYFICDGFFSTRCNCKHIVCSMNCCRGEEEYGKVVLQLNLNDSSARN